MDIVNVRDQIQEFVSLLDTAPERYQELFTHLDKCNKLTNDIVHDIEFARFDADEYGFQNGYEKAKRLQEIRQERRRYKDQIEYYKLLKDYALKSKQFKESLEDLLLSFEEILEEQSKRRYVSRASGDDLSCEQHVISDLERKWNEHNA